MPVSGSTSAAGEHFNDIVVPVPVRVIALAISCAIFFLGERIGVQAVAGAHHVAAAEISLHASPRYSANISGVSYTRTRLSFAPPAAFTDGSSRRQRCDRDVLGGRNVRLETPLPRD